MSQKWLCTCVLILTCLLLWVVPCAAQIAIGDEVQLQGNGTLSAGYAGQFSDASASGHGLNFGVNGNLSGFYHSPNFVSFNVLPYFNQSQNNSAFQTLNDNSGVTATANIFGRSNFPGTVSFNKGYNAAGTFGVPDLPNFTTHGSTEGFGVSWSALLPDLPTLTATYTKSSGSSEVYGTSDQSTSSNQTFGLRSSYEVAHFNLNANYIHTNTQSQTPDLLGRQQEVGLKTGDDVYGVSASHPLFWRGAFSAYFNRIDFNDEYQGGNHSSTIDNQTATAVFHPTTKWFMSVSENYTDNLAGTLTQAILQTGALPPEFSGSNSHSLSLTGQTSYLLVKGLGVSAQVTHIDQSFAGQNTAATLFNGTLYGDYGKKLFGLINWSVSLLDSANEVGNRSLGVLANVGISRRIGAWDVSGNFNYAKNVQTLLLLYTNSYYRFGGSINHRFSQNVRWNATASETQNEQEGSYSHSQNYASTFSLHWLALTGDYSKSNGLSLLTANGLQPITVPPGLLPPGQSVLYGGSSYGASITANPTRKLVLWGVYVNAHSDTTETVINSANRNDLFNVSVQYQLRKLGFRGGYTKLDQNISATGTAPKAVSSFYFGVYRWFSFY
jgi:hypothetical protein